MKRILIWILAFALLLTGCGAEYANGGMAMDSMAPEAEEKYEGIYDEAVDGSGSTADSTAYPEQKLIKTVEMNTETEDLDALLTTLTGHIRELGGYTEYQNIHNGSNYSGYRRRSAELTIRIPAGKLDGFVTRVEDDSNVISRTESIDDVTLQYVDTESRVKALQAEHDRLVELMEQAETMYDLLEIESRLTDVRYELESVTARLRVLENKVSYATVKLWINEVKVLTEVDEQTVWQRMGSGFTENLRNIGQDLQDFCVWAVSYSPQLVIFAAVVTLAVTLLRRSARKRRARRMNPQTPPETPQA